MKNSYPDTGAARDQWILARRPARNEVDATRPVDFFVEEERSHMGEIVPVATIFLTNRECPWRCLMCDLWRSTLTNSVSIGAIPAQIDYALSRLPLARHVKLYNSGSFFDTRAIPVEDHAAIAERVKNFERVIVESHPALIDDSCARFRGMVKTRLEVAMGLETVHPEILPRLNKKMSLEQFSAAAGKLRCEDIDLRVFILVQPPFMPADEALRWAGRSLDFAFDNGAGAATLIPTRAGNGALEQLALQGQFTQPALATLEAAVCYGLSLRRGRVFSDLWALDSFSLCPGCKDARIARLREMNLTQTVANRVTCESCEGSH